MAVDKVGWFNCSSLAFGRFSKDVTLVLLTENEKVIEEFCGRHSDGQFLPRIKLE